MDNDFKFTWAKMGICFPEWKEDMGEEDFNNLFPLSPNFTNEKVSFAYKGEYGVQIYFNQSISFWIKEISKKRTLEREYTMISKMHSYLSHKLHANLLKELDSSFQTIDSWRKFIRKGNEVKWVGDLKNNIDFKNESEKVSLWDYYDIKGNSPTGILCEIQKLPEDSLNEKWKKYYDLSKNVSSNTITGKTLGECIKNADEIYKIIDELKGLKF